MNQFFTWNSVKCANGPKGANMLPERRFPNPQGSENKDRFNPTTNYIYAYETPRNQVVEPKFVKLFTN